MNEYQNKVDNSYESSSSGSASNSVGDNNATHNSMNFDANEGLAALILPSSCGLGFYTETVAEEATFPLIATASTVPAPSYEPEYDYYNQYSTTPLVYSWMPIVPGFSQDGSHNLHNFEHIVRKVPQPLDISGNDGNSSIVSDQNKRYEKCLVLNDSDQKVYILNNSNGMSFNHQLEDSCNAIDLSVSCNDETKNSNLDLSFNGKFPELTLPDLAIGESAKDDSNVNDATNEEDDDEDEDERDRENSAIIEHFSIIEQQEQQQGRRVLVPLREMLNSNSTEDRKKEVDDDDDDEEEENEAQRLRNESFELLKKEDSSKMLYLNEKSPVVEKCDAQEDIVNEAAQQTDSSQLHEDMDIDVQSEARFEVQLRPDCLVNQYKEMAEKTRDNRIAMKPRSPLKLDQFLMTRIKKALGDKPVPASISELPLSLSEMLGIYNANIKLTDDSFKVLQSDYIFRPTRSFKDTLQAEWPEAMDINGPGLMYNRSNACEETELMALKYTDRFIKAETASSFNHKISPTSAKKRTEKLKLITQSPGRRLSHLANRRKVFSSANLKSSSTSQGLNKSYSGNGQMLIDKAKLYQKKKRLSAKKLTPGKKVTPNKRVTHGKKKTPVSGKRQALSLSIYKPETSAAEMSKRALFTSPILSKSFGHASTSRDLPSRTSMLPKRSLFSPAQKRKRSPSPDVENRFSKTRRLASPKHLPISKSLSVTIAPSTATSSSFAASGLLDEHYKKTLYYRSQPELNQSLDASKKNSLGFRKPMSETEKKKLLWAASSALQSKKINREHEKFKDYMGTLCKLVKKIFGEFYNSAKSMSSQMTKFAHLMVFYVVQGRHTFDEIYAMTKSRLEAQNPTKITGYIAREDFEKSLFVRHRSSLLLVADSNSSLNLNHSSDAFPSDISGSDTSLTRSTSKSNTSSVLRENILSHENSSKKAFSANDSNLSQLKTSTPSSNVLKAKRQISF